MKSIGFTGTQDGMTSFQMESVEKILQRGKEKGYTDFHHGDCIGADEQAHSIAIKLGYRVIIHPPINSSKRAYCKGDYHFSKKEYIDRNHAIVDASRIMIATPKENTEKLRSGTWATIRYAKKMKKPVMIVYPNRVEIIKGE